MTIKWCEIGDKEDSKKYHARILEMAVIAKVGMCYRRGGGTDLGLQMKDEEIKERAYAVWGVPPWIGPQQLPAWLEENAWKITATSEPRGRNAPWRIVGHCEGDGMAFKVKLGDRTQHINIVSWRSSGRRYSEEEPERLGNRRWHDPNSKFELSPTAHFTAEIAATVPDTCSTQATQVSQPPAASKNGGIKSPAKKKQKIEELTVKGGQKGPHGMVTLDLGGAGDCGWRAVAFLICCINGKWKEEALASRQKAESLGKSLRGQITNHLLHQETTWMAAWAPDDTWTNATEGGVPAQTLDEFKKALLRPQRWICQLGLQCISTTKRLHICMWQLRVDGWVRIALCSPDNPTARTPVVHLALCKGHYMPLMKDGKNPYPSTLDSLGKMVQGSWISRGMERDNIEETDDCMGCDVFRAAGEGDFLTPMKVSSKTSMSSNLKTFENDEDHDRLLRSVSSIDEMASLDALRTCSSIKSTCSKKSGSPGAAQTESQMKTLKWSCKFCSMKMDINGETSLKIAQHMKKFHRQEYDEAIRHNKDEGLSKFSGFGLRKLRIPLSFKKLTKSEKENTKLVCPYCELGVVNPPNSAWLLRKSRKHHLKNCKKKPEGKVTLTMLRAAVLKKKNLWLPKEISKKSGSRPVEKTMQQAKIRGHKPVFLACKLPYKCMKRSKHLFVCQTCKATSRPNRHWKRECIGYQRRCVGAAAEPFGGAEFCSGTTQRTSTSFLT
eukprot:s5354_g3.t1